MYDKEEGNDAVVLEADAVIFDGFVERDRELLALARDADDLEALMHRVIEVGARAYRVAQVSVDVAVVDDAFEDMKSQLGKKLEETVERIGSVASGLLDSDSGAVPTALNAWRGEFERLLGDSFDPDSKKSIIAKMDVSLETARDELVDAVKQVVNADAADSPMRRMWTEVERTVKDQAETVRKAVSELTEKVIADRSREEGMAEVYKITTAKGTTFEESVHLHVVDIASVFGDVADHVATETGANGGKVGDEVVEVNSADTRGVPGRYVLEAKDRGGLGLRKILGELDEAMTNRAAQAAVAVFARPEIAPVRVPFQDFGDRAIVVLSGEEDDGLPLRLACLWARAVVRRKLAGNAEAVDVSRIEALVDEARRALQRVTIVKRGHSTAKKAIGQAAEQMTELVEEVEHVLEALCQEIGK